MKKALAGLVVVVFAGLLCTSLLTLFDTHSVDDHYVGMLTQYPYYMAY